MKEETAAEKWDRGKTLMLESLYKPDTKLRGCAHNQGCYDELMKIEDYIFENERLDLLDGSGRPSGLYI